jgi:hypothetical protein
MLQKSKLGLPMDYGCDYDEKKRWYGATSWWYHHLADVCGSPRMPAINTQKNTYARATPIIPSARLILHFTKLCTNLKNDREKRFLCTKVTSEAFLSISPKIWRTHVFRVAHKRNFELVDETLILQGHLNDFGTRSWLCCAPADGLTKNFVKQNV